MWPKMCSSETSLKIQSLLGNSAHLWTGKIDSHSSRSKFLLLLFSDSSRWFTNHLCKGNKSHILLKKINRVMERWSELSTEWLFLGSLHWVSSGLWAWMLWQWQGLLVARNRSFWGIRVWTQVSSLSAFISVFSYTHPPRLYQTCK